MGRKICFLPILALLGRGLLAYAEQTSTPVSDQATPSSGCSDETCMVATWESPEHDTLSLLQKNAELRRAQHMGSDKLVQTTVAHETKVVGPKSLPVTLYDHILRMVGDTLTSAAPVCSEFYSNPTNYAVALGIPSFMVILFASMSYYLSVIFPRPPASESIHRVTRVDANGFPVSINWHFVTWTGLAIGMANVNYVVVLPIAVENFSGNMLEAGLWVGLYAVGALISMPVFIALGHHWTRTCLVLHGVTTLIGNAIMIHGAMIQSIPWLMTGRVCTGLAFGIYYTCNNGCLYLIPTWDRLEAIFISRAVYSIGFALGPCISPICNYVLTTQPWVMDLFPNYNAAAEGTPLILMGLYGLIYTLGAIFVFKEIEILDAETEGLGVGGVAGDPASNNATPEEIRQAMVMFSSTVFTNFTRNFIRVMWETGTVVILAKIYCVATGAGIAVSIVAITLVVSRNAMTKLGLWCKGDNALLMRFLEWGGALSLPFMFMWGMKPSVLTLSMFLIGGIIFYNSNASQSGVLLALGGETAIPGHFWLDKVALNTYMYISMLVAYIFGPVSTFVSQALNPGQNTVATMVGSVIALQILITFSTISSKEQAAPFETTKEKSMNDKLSTIDEEKMKK